MKRKSDSVRGSGESVVWKVVNSYQGAAKVIVEYNGSMLRALMDTYPDIGLEKSRFDLINSMLASSSHPVPI